MSTLPPALAGWSASLEALTPSVAAALGPMLLRLDELVARHAEVDGPDGEPDGLAGLTRRGTPERLLVSEWLLAQELPDEFLRRAAAGELLHLATGYRHDPPHGVVRVLLDAGPDQLGAGRLVQLAALVVLHRRAAAAGAELRLGVLGEPADRWLAGDLPELLRDWLAARRPVAPEVGDVAARLDGLAGADRVWLVAAPALAANPGLPQGIHQVLTSAESSWSAEGARSVAVRLAGESLTLQLPAGPEAVRALRGEGFRRRAAAPGRPGSSADGDDTAIRHAFFPGAARRLVGLGRDDEIVSIAVPVTPGAGPAAERLMPAKRVGRRFPGPVLAVGAVGSRLVALHRLPDVDPPSARLRVIGKHLAGFDGLTVSLAELGADGSARMDWDRAVWPLGPLLFRSGGFVLRLGGDWWAIGVDGRLVPAPLRTAAATGTVDHPQLVWSAYGGGLRLGGNLVVSPFEARQVHAGHGWIAWSGDGDRWQLVQDEPHPADPVTIQLPSGCQVFGLLTGEPGRPDLVIATPERGLALAGPDRTRPLARIRSLEKILGEWSRQPSQEVAVHPLLPLVAVPTAGDEIEVLDARSGTTLCRVPG